MSNPQPDQSRNRMGIMLGLTGVLAFSLTLPMTRVAVRDFDASFVAFGRMAVAGLLTAALLVLMRTPLPPRAQWPALAGTAVGVVFGFPLCTSLAMTGLPSAQGAVVTGLLPLATAALAAWWFKDRQSTRFWVCAAAGAVIVVGFALRDGLGGHLTGYLWMLAAVALGAVGYALGARASAAMGGVQVIMWALTLSLPISLPLALWRMVSVPPQGSVAAWSAFAYVTLISQLVGFFAWYNGLRIGGIAQVGQLQLMQVFFTLAFAALWFGESPPVLTWVVAVAVIALIVMGRSGPRPAPAA